MPAAAPHFDPVRVSRLAVTLLFALMMVREVSADEIPLTDSGTEKRDLVFVDENTLVYCEQIEPNQLALMQLDLTNGAATRLHPDFDDNEFEPAFSRDGERYAFLQNIGNLNLRLIIRNRNTGEESAFSEGGFSGMRSPCFTADGSRLLYAYPEDGRQHIWSCDLACQDRKRVIDSSGTNNWPNATPGGDFVFGSTRDGNFDIYRANTDGSGIEQLTFEPQQDIRPRVSLDGEQIAFTSNRDGNYEIYVMRIDGTGLRRITQHDERDDFATWSPNGDLAFVSERNGRFDIYLIPLEE